MYRNNYSMSLVLVRMQNTVLLL